MSKKKKDKAHKGLSQSAQALRSNGLKAFQRGDYEQAITIWERIPAALRPIPALAEAHFRQGLVPGNNPSPEPQTALQHLQQASALQPDDPCYALYLGMAAHRAGDLEMALPAYRAARQRPTPFAARAAYPLGLALFQNGQDAAGDPVWDALTDDERGLILHAHAFRRRPYLLPPDAPALWRAFAALDSGDEAAADSHLRAAVTTASPAGQGLARHYLGVLAAQREDWETARREWSRAYAGGLRTPKLEHNLGELFHRMAEDLLGRGDPSTALEAAQEAARHTPDNKALNQLRAHLYQHLGYQAASASKWEQAQAHWQTAVELDSGSFRLAYNLALACERGGNHLAAAHAWREALRRRPRRTDHPDALTSEQVARLWQRTAEAYLKAEEFDEAIKVYQQAVKWDPENVPLRLAQAENLMSLGRLRAAENELLRILDREPNHIPALLHMGETLFRSEQWWVRSGAPRFWEKALALEPGCLPARQALADYYRDQAEINYSWDNYAAAEEDYRKALEYQPEDALTLAALASCLVRMKDEASALPLIENALALAPDDLDVLDEILSAWITTGQEEKAWNIMDAAETRIPEIPAEFYASKAVECVEAGHKDQADLWLARAQAKAKPDEPILLMIGEFLMNVDGPLARPYLEQALAAGQNPGQVYLDLAILDERAGNSKESKKHFQEAERLARKTNDAELTERIEIARIFVGGPLAFMNRLMQMGNPDLMDDFFSTLLEDGFDD